MEAIILAGGLGTRLKQVIADMPKPMAPVNGIPFLTYILDYLVENGTNRVIMAVGYKWESIKRHYGSKYKDLDIVYSVENEPLGTGGAIKQALNLCFEKEVFIINGDTYFKVDLKQMKKAHLEYTADLTIATKIMYNFDRYGTIIIEKCRIIKFEEKQFKEYGLINGGVYLCNKNILEQISENKFSFEKDFLEKELLNNKIFSFESQEYFIDIGIPEDYKNFEKEMSND